MSVVTLVGTKERKKGVIQSIRSLGINPVRGKDVFRQAQFQHGRPCARLHP